MRFRLFLWFAFGVGFVFPFGSRSVLVFALRVRGGFVFPFGSRSVSFFLCSAFVLVSFFLWFAFGGGFCCSVIVSPVNAERRNRHLTRTKGGKRSRFECSGWADGIQKTGVCAWGAPRGKHRFQKKRRKRRGGKAAGGNAGGKRRGGAGGKRRGWKRTPSFSRREYGRIFWYIVDRMFTRRGCFNPEDFDPNGMGGCSRTPN